ncbi:MMPL family transporter [Novipirellula artificiosorum]|uniref:Membrane transport protein mmpL8 n=1 Tax=Novipirellula artificiosorum TaxID=2528016 RepID=A0A5C6E1J6_9BACT|nr:MMPL family transporter [Novipirellula artificiosorum]TWU42595.1 Membrane transport protein mmpL8 [Novipirellula artificiosorum]
MNRSLSHRWAQFVTRRWRWVLLAWIVAVVLLRIAAPSWKEIAFDGDFEYLPAKMTSVAGTRLLNDAFPGIQSRSQIVLVLGREKEELLKSDDIIGLDLLRRLYHQLGVVSWKRAIDAGYQSGPPEQQTSAGPWIKLAREAFDQSIELDERYYERIADQLTERPPTLTQPRLAIAYWDRGRLLERWGDADEAVEADFEAALILIPEIPKMVAPIAKRDLEAWQSLLDVLAWEDPVVGTRLRKPAARLAVLQLSSELAATGNIQIVEALEALIAEVTHDSMRYTKPGLQLLMTGSAAIGGETLMGARDAIRYTEWITVGMILLILTIVYRAPLLVAIPMASIGFAVVASMSLVAILTQLSMKETIPLLDMRVFTTSRIFIVVLLFGAGTDYCLFLIARLREEACQNVWPVACRNAVSGVMGALIGSAMTTVLGLGMLWIAQFGKFHYTGPVIAICLLVGLLVCTTLTPALLTAFGPIVFWPNRINLRKQPKRSLLGPSPNRSFDSHHGGTWGWIAVLLTRYPATAILFGGMLLSVPGVYGFLNERSVTYDLSSQLNHAAKSRQGLRLLARHFNIGEINPVTVLFLRAEDTPRDKLGKDVKQLTTQLYAQDGVAAVRNADDPLGDFPPSRDMSLFGGDAWRRRALQNHRIAQRYFYSEVPEYEKRLVRLDVIIDGDPFSLETSTRVSKLEAFLRAQTLSKESVWKGSKVLLAGTTPSIIDLRKVTLSDNRRIKIAVVVAVFAVLVLVLRQVVLSLYLIITVLISYYATLGLTILFFRAAYGSDYVGLDWKLPLFLFVILVAVGQDYNVYLVTRVLEEQRQLGWRAALRRAVSRTGGIITACGLVMAATFFSMTAAVWLPPIARFFGFPTQSGVALRGIVELGFALGLGVLIDTFYVRTILVPSFIALMGRWSLKKPS